MCVSWQYYAKIWWMDVKETWCKYEEDPKKNLLSGCGCRNCSYVSSTKMPNASDATSTPRQSALHHMLLHACSLFSFNKWIISMATSVVLAPCWLLHEGVQVREDYVTQTITEWSSDQHYKWWSRLTKRSCGTFQLNPTQKTALIHLFTISTFPTSTPVQFSSARHHLKQ